MDLRSAGVDVAREALGRTARLDPIEPGGGGPAGNARLTAWAAMVLLVLLVAELLTTIDVRGLIGWHLVIGVLLVPPALLKIVSAGWRVVGYYAGRRPYRQAGPPPAVLRVLGPFVVATTLSLLGSGLLLILLGPQSSRRVLLDVLGQRVDWVTVHQAIFVGWAIVTGLHVLGRLVPAWRLVRTGDDSRPVPGTGRRGAVLVLTGLVAVLTVLLIWPGTAGWRAQPHEFPERPPGRAGGR